MFRSMLTIVVQLLLRCQYLCVMAATEVLFDTGNKDNSASMATASHLMTINDSSILELPEMWQTCGQEMFDRPTKECTAIPSLVLIVAEGTLI